MQITATAEGCRSGAGGCGSEAGGCRSGAEAASHGGSGPGDGGAVWGGFGAVDSRSGAAGENQGCWGNGGCGEETGDSERSDLDGVVACKSWWRDGQGQVEVVVTSSREFELTMVFPHFFCRRRCCRRGGLGHRQWRRTAVQA